MRQSFLRIASVTLAVLAFLSFSGPSAESVVVPVSSADMAPVMAALREGVPDELQGKRGTDLEAAWESWLARQRADIQLRLDRGDEDSLVNFWLFGTSFTKVPPARERELARLDQPASVTRVLGDRLEDLIAGIASPGDNERLQFARELLERRGIDARTREGKERIRRLLREARARALAEFQHTDSILRAAERRNDVDAWLAARSTIFRERGLSSDTSILVDFALDQALAALKAAGTFRAGEVRRVAIIGPGLDFINKADGYDFYPQQTLQPFALADSLIRLGLGAGALEIATFDVSSRVNHHLDRARDRARQGNAYVVHLPLSRSERWTMELRSYWQRFGDQIGVPVQPVRPPFDGDVEVRAIQIRPDIVSQIVPQTMNVVLERAVVSSPAQQFDLVVATNVFVYYGPFEQAVAVANVAAMLRPGGILLTNDYTYPTPPMQPAVGQLPVIYSGRQQDTLFSYQRR